MARSTYVYIVTDPDKTVLAPFTVKHEAQTWLRRRETTDNDLVWLTVGRHQDGSYSPKPPTFMTAYEFLTT
jgi:hypothetical protein